MFNYYLLNESYVGARIAEIESSLQTLNDLAVDERKSDDYFLKHESIWYVSTAEGDFADVVFSKLEDKQLSNIVLPKLFNSIQSIENPIDTFAEFDALYKVYNAFYGINFQDLPADRCISNQEAYDRFRATNLWDITPDSLWERREALFSRVVLCPGIEKDLKAIGGTYLDQIVNKLTALDRYAVNSWHTGNFSYLDANANTSLNISPESKKTMDHEKLRNQRIFSMPDETRECFELHVKTGNLRFYFLPKDLKIYVGYIGKHLETSEFK
jgi:hypothetical protein